MKKLYTLLLFSFFIPVLGFSQSNNINVSNTVFFGGEPYLAVNPTSPQNIVIAWMAADFSTSFKVAIKSKVSFNGGATWSNQFIQPHFGAIWSSADVSMQFRPNGTLYLSYVDYH